MVSITPTAVTCVPVGLTINTMMQMKSIAHLILPLQPPNLNSDFHLVGL